jgi:hypothetical protein
LPPQLHLWHHQQQRLLLLLVSQCPAGTPHALLLLLPLRLQAQLTPAHPGCC